MFTLAACSAHMTGVEPEPASPVVPASLRVVVYGPARALYDPIGLGIGRQVVVTLANDGAAAVRVGGVDVAFAAKRNGVAAPCEEHAPSHVRGPTTIAPAATASFVRDLDCKLAVPGHYAVRVLAAWDGAALHDVGGFALDVVDSAGRGPRPITGRPGLLAAVAGAPLVAPTTGYEATIAILNESAMVQPLGVLRVVLRSKPDYKDLWCVSPATDLAAPEVLASGRMHVVRARLHCDLSKTGTYVVMASVVLEGSSEPSEAGEMRVRVTSDPTDLVPLP